MHATNLLLALMCAAAIILSGATSDAATGGWSGFDAVPDRDTQLVVDWSYVTHPENFPGCTGRTADAGLADRVVILEDGSVQRLTFGQVDAAVKGGQRLWVVGSC